jgi:hypothetical protein
MGQEWRCSTGVRRSASERAIVGEIRAWSHGQRALPRSTLGNAITYLLGL